MPSPPRFSRPAPLALVVAILSALLLSACGGPPDPIAKINSLLQGVPTYSIVLDDMKEEGNFFKHYYHKYKVITPEEQRSSDWMEVPGGLFEDYLPFLGMTVYVKKDGQGQDQAGPPGYEYVGDDRYGSWHRDSSGGSFWVFYGQYRLLGDLLGGGRSTGGTTTRTGPRVPSNNRTTDRTRNTAPTVP